MSQVDKKALTITEVTEAVKIAFSSKSYSSRYIREIEQALCFIQDYANKKDIIDFDPSLREDICTAYYNQRKSKYRSVFERVINAMINYYNHGDILRRIKQSETPWNSPFNDLFSGFYFEYKSKGWSKSSCTQVRRSLLGFSEYLNVQGISSIEDITEENLIDFIGTKYKDNTAHHKKRVLMDLRRFFEYILSSGVQTKVFEHSFPSVRAFDDSESIQYVFTKNEVEKLLSVVDKGNPIGKRDYAILLIASRYGMRACDIRSLKFSDINWAEDKLSIIQSKTGETLDLPLFKDIGWAIIDYIDNGRPISSCPYIFIIHNAPYDRFLASMNHIVEKYINLAGITIPKGKNPGIHSFRRYVASELLKNGVEISAIKEVLGHNSIQTTAKYQKIDITQMSVCSLEVPYGKH